MCSLDAQKAPLCEAKCLAETVPSLRAALWDDISIALSHLHVIGANLAILYAIFLPYIMPRMLNITSSPVW